LIVVILPLWSVGVAAIVVVVVVVRSFVRSFVRLFVRCRRRYFSFEPSAIQLYHYFHYCTFTFLLILNISTMINSENEFIRKFENVTYSMIA